MSRVENAGLTELKKSHDLTFQLPSLVQMASELPVQRCKPGWSDALAPAYPGSVSEMTSDPTDVAEHSPGMCEALVSIPSTI